MVLFEPSGSNQVAAFDLLTEHGRSGVLLRLFYPAEASAQNSIVSHHYTDPQCVQGALEGFGRSLWLGGLLRWAFSWLSIRCIWRGRILPPGDNGQLPVVVLSHGLGGNRHLYSSLCLELASHGCVVAAVEHRDGSACATFHTSTDSADSANPAGADPTAAAPVTVKWLPLERRDLSDEAFYNGQALHRAGECLLAAQAVLSLGRGRPPLVVNRMPRLGVEDAAGDSAVDEALLLAQFKGRIDENRVHLMGHSFGGSAALTTLAKAPAGLFRTCSLMDCWMQPVDPQHYTGIQLPVLFINNQLYHHFYRPQLHNFETNAKRLQQVQDGIADVDKKTCVSIRGTTHLAQMDVAHFLWPRLGRALSMCGDMEPRRATVLTAAIFRAFMAKHEGGSLSETEQQLLSGEHPDCFPGLGWKPPPDTGRPG